MNEAAKRIAESLKKAMQAEHEGHHFYRMAAESTSDAKGKEMFQYLADEEMTHFNFLRAQYKAFLEEGRPDRGITLASEKRFGQGHPIFSSEIKDRVKGAHYEMTALSIGMQLELSAVEFYKKEAEVCAEPYAQAFFQELAQWEQGHLDALRAQSDSLKEAYWNQVGFSPF